MDNQTLAAHQIAKHLRELARWLNEASEDAWRAFLPGAENIKSAYLDMLELKAQRVEATAPFTPITDVDRGAMADMFTGMLEDMSSDERIEYYCDNWTEAEWRYEYDQMVDELGPDPTGDYMGRNE